VYEEQEHEQSIRTILVVIEEQPKPCLSYCWNCNYIFDTRRPEQKFGILFESFEYRSVEPNCEP